MIKFSEAEKQVLFAFAESSRGKEKPNQESLEKIGKFWFGKKLVDWTSAYESLTKKRLMREKNKVFSLTSEGGTRAKKIHKEYLMQEFTDGLIRSEKSKAYAVFCERLYGKNLCQFNMMDMTQLKKLLDVLNLNKNNRVLDLGCGIGAITEYISDLTQAHITGIDFASGAIKRAQERSRKKQKRLTFQKGNMNNIDFPVDTFDTIISIDTFYFVDDLEKTVGQMKAVLKSGGQMGIFFTQMMKPEDSKELLLPEKTKLAQVLKQHNLNFQTWDFTENEHRIWRKCKELAEELKSEFETEKNLDLYDDRINETEHMLKLVDSGRMSRYLYHVRY